MYFFAKQIYAAFFLTIFTAMPPAQPATSGATKFVELAYKGRSIALNRESPSVITASSFGFQCGTGKPTNCPNAAWPTTIAQPGMLRLWDSQVQWHMLNTAPGVYDWRTLDKYLDSIAAHQPRDTMYTFGYTPCWDTKGECQRGWGSTYPPSDLNASGSASFNAFVSALVGHCSQAHHCVKDLIKYWEMWNEANTPNYWHGTVEQLYDLMAPAIPLIRANLPGASILTPPANRGDTDWMKAWMNLENSKGRLSDIFSFHLYLQDKTPETRFEIVRDVVEVKDSMRGWADKPWMNSETNFDAATFSCSRNYDADDCAGQIVRWHLLHLSFGARQLSWYFFNTTIGHNPEFSNVYHTMMEWLVGGRFAGVCSADASVITCPFLEANGRAAMFAWNFRGESSYTPDQRYTTYKTLDGTESAISRNQQIRIGIKPVMLESAH